MERFHLKKLSKAAGKEKYQVKISNKFAATDHGKLVETTQKFQQKRVQVTMK
jgi:hypothetical protein